MAILSMLEVKYKYVFFLTTQVLLLDNGWHS